MVAATPLESYMLSLINSDRAKAGVGALKFDGELNTAADGHSAWMDATNTLSHTGSGGSNPGARIDAAGYDSQGWSENVAYASDRGAAGLDKADVDVLHANLMNSPGHHKNLMDPNMKDVGIGLRMDDKSAWVTEVFGRPTARQDGESDDGAGGAAPAPAPSPAPAPIPVPVKPTSGIKLTGTAGSDKLVGTGGDDILIGGKGADYLTGGKGSDTFVFRTVKDGIDKISDFKIGVDLIDVSKIHGEIEQQRTSAGMLIEVEQGAHDIGLVMLLGVHQALPESSFIH